MELREFINEALTQITQGVKDAQEGTKETGAIINPSHLGTGAKGDKYLYVKGWRYTTEIELSVAVSVQEKEGKKAGIGVVTGLLAGGAGHTSDHENSSVSTIKFSVPIALPVAELPPDTPDGTKKIKTY